jgi:hypothetical protein
MITWRGWIPIGEGRRCKEAGLGFCALCLSAEKPAVLRVRKARKGAIALYSWSFSEYRSAINCHALPGDCGMVRDRPLSGITAETPTHLLERRGICYPEQIPYSTDSLKKQPILQIVFAASDSRYPLIPAAAYSAKRLLERASICRSVRSRC